MALFHLIYVSSAREEFATAELDRILVSSAHHNTPQHITGMLLYTAGSFMQVLEGEESTIDETYARITKDPRHKDLYLIEREAIEQRNFPVWCMGFKRLAASDAAAHPAYAAFFSRGFDATLLGARPGLPLDLLKTFAGDRRG